FQAVPELVRAMEQLDEEKFPKLMAYLNNPISQRVRTNNHVERTNRMFRFLEKVRYKWRRRKTLVRFVVLTLDDVWSDWEPPQWHEGPIAQNPSNTARRNPKPDKHHAKSRDNLVEISEESLPYSEKFAWEHGQYDPSLNALAQYHKAERSWVFIQAFSGGVDGMRSLTHASLVRRYMDRCAKWTSSYRLVLSMVQEIDIELRFEDRDLISSSYLGVEEARSQALWDVIFARL